MPDLQHAIIELISKPTYQPVKAKALAKKLGVSQSQYTHFRQILKSLIKDGRAEMGKSNAIRPAKPHGTVVGTFRRAQAGFGFVRPLATEPMAGQEIYIKAHNARDAANGDQVLVRVVKKPKRADLGPEGEILRVVERATVKFVGTYFTESDEGLVRVDAGTFSEPIYVGDPGAKGAKEEDKVVFEMIRFPTPALRGEGVLTEVLGPRGEPGVDTISIIRAFNLPDEFPEDVLNEARRQAQEFDENDLMGREDYTDEVVITIDPVDARDFDDAVMLSYDSRKKHWTLGVHIADVGHFAPPGSLLDREARNRGTSVYLPQRVLPMFPEIISNGLASLQQGRVRYVKSAIMEFTHAGQGVSSTFANGAIRARRRFTYEQVSRILEDPDTAPFDLEPEVIDLLLRMKEFALVLRQRRFKHGALELFIPETALDFDAEGKVSGAHFVTHDISHQVIEEFMLAANEAVAQQLDDLGVPFLRRVHTPPDPVKLKDYIEFVRTLGYDANAKKPTDRFQLQRILHESSDKPEVYAIHYALLRSLKQAGYSPADEGHYALASENYCHFTSPIRRYPDLTVHRLLDQWLRTGKCGSDMAELVALGEHCSFTERRAAQAERELTKVKLLDYMSERIGLEMDAIITGVHEYGFFCQAETMPVEGLVHVSNLADDYYYYEASTHSLIGRRTKRRFRLGDKVKVKVARVDLDRRQLDFRLVEGQKRKDRR